jgi:hypothetical protein
MMKRLEVPKVDLAMGLGFVGKIYRTMWFWDAKGHS